MIWRAAEVDAAAAEALVVSTGLPAPLARALILRGVTSAAAADRFLRPRLSDLSDPLEIPGMAVAVERLWHAVESQESVVIFGDYDVDGVTSCGLLIQIFSALGLRASPYLPNRMDEGYGLTADAVDRCRTKFRPTLIVTVDCGTGSIEAVDRARALGIDVIVTDHHEVPGATAKPLALVNPKLGGNQETRMLAGVGVAFKLCHALLAHGREHGNAACETYNLLAYLDLVALGTIADIVPLRGENRILASHGLACLNRREHIGLRALMDVAAINGRIGTYQVGFVLGPRMNAAGRISDAET
ncbi:MAG: DHH family phosphoesterase, partial [bacterium]